MRRYLIIAAAVIVILGIGTVVYFYFFNGAPTVIVSPPNNSNLPTAEQGSTNTSTGTVATTPAATVTAKLVQISKGPVVPGEVAIDKRAPSASSSPDVSISYLERQSGNAFTYLVHSKTLTRTSNKTIPGIQSAAWLPDGSMAYVRYLSGDNSATINTYALAATSSQGFFLAQNLSDISVASTSVLTLASGVNGSIASLLRTDGSHPMNVFSTPLSALRLSFAGRGRYLAVTKASGTLAGDAFIYDGTTSSSRVAGPLLGLTALPSPKGTWLLVSSTANNTLQMQLVNISTHESIPLPVATLTDKCVWTSDESAIYCGVPADPPSALYPDDWYQGVVHFSDRIWKINVAGRYAELVLDFSQETSAALDAEALAVDPSATTLVFVNKNDGSLWSYSL